MTQDETQDVVQGAPDVMPMIAAEIQAMTQRAMVDEHINGPPAQSQEQRQADRKALAEACVRAGINAQWNDQCEGAGDDIASRWNASDIKAIAAVAALEVDGAVTGLGAEEP